MELWNNFLNFMGNRDTQLMITMLCLMGIMTPMVLPRKTIKALLRRKYERRLARMTTEERAAVTTGAGIDPQPRLGKIQSCKLMNSPEHRLYRLLLDLLPDHFHPRAQILPQVSLLAFLTTQDSDIRKDLGWRRVDFLVVDPDFFPLCVIEYQGRGHAGNTANSARSTYWRDWKKRRTFDDARIPLVEIPEQFSRDQIARLLSQLSGRGRQSGAG